MIKNKIRKCLQKKKKKELAEAEQAPAFGSQTEAAAFWQLIVFGISRSRRLIRSNHVGLIPISSFLRPAAFVPVYKAVRCLIYRLQQNCPSFSVQTPPFPSPPPPVSPIPNSLLRLSWLNHFLAFSMPLIGRHCEVNCQETRP